MAVAKKKARIGKGKPPDRQGIPVGRHRSPDQVLADEVSKFYHDPLGYVMFMFPWDEDESLKLVPLPEKYRKRFPNCEYGPDEWACDFLDQVGRETKKRNFDGKVPVEPLYFATVSGHEIGKSCLVAWLVKWILDTRPGSKISLTAVTDEQLRTKTWAEVGKWHRRSLTQHWYEYNSSRGNMSLIGRPKYTESRADARTCREEKSESFAGQHAPTATSAYIFDEASGIPSKVFEVREGGLTSGEPMVFDFGNGTRNSGAFYEECVGRLRGRFIVRSIDSRSVAITNKAKIERDRVDYGEDSDFFKVRWRGLFPDKSHSQFIATEHVEAAMDRDDVNERHAALVIGVDVARKGDDDSVIWARRGLDARSWGPEIVHEYETDILIGRITECFNQFKALGLPPAMIFVDEGNTGGAVVDFLRKLGYPVTGVMFGSKPIDSRHYRFKSDEIWGRMRDSIQHGLVLPRRHSQHGERIHAELTQREYGFMIDGEKLHLETKDEMKSRGLTSPDMADALAITFAQDVADVPEGLASNNAGAVDTEYDPFENLSAD